MNRPNSDARFAPIAPIKWLAAVALSFVAPCVRADFAIYTVGGDAACQFSTIQNAIDAAAQHPGEDYVWVASNQSYTNQHVVVTNQDVDIEGGFTDCNDFDPAFDKTTVSGTSGHSVFEIEGNSNVYMRGFNITGGNLDDLHRGGGIFFGGQGSLAVGNTSIYSNTAGYGAGISMSPSGAGTLSLLAGALIFNNTASVSGGGIRVEGNTKFYALQSPTWIGDNHAPNGYGGGIEVLGPARADIGSAGFNGAGVVSENDAAYGGGLDVLDIGKGSPVVRFFAQSATLPSAISNNLATINGGGIYQLDTAYVCLFATHVDGNIAEDGAALYSADSADVEGPYHPKGLFINGGAPAAIGGEACGSTTPEELGGASSCSAGTASCSTFANNVTKHSDNTPSAGTVISVLASDITLNRIRLNNNTAARIVEARGGDTFNIAFALFDDNSVSDVLIVEGMSNIFSMNRSTIAGNTIGSGTMIVQSYTPNYSLTNDILYQFGKTIITLSGTPGIPNLAYLLSNSTGGLPQQNPSIISGKPTFVDPANGDYHLAQGSLGMDFAPPTTGTDLANNPSSIDLPYVKNTFGPSDLGAYEMQQTCGASDTFFCNGFEGD